MQVDSFHYTQEVLDVLFLFEAASTVCGQRKLSSKSLDYEEKLTLHKIHSRGIAQVEYHYDGVEYHYHVLLTLQTMQVLSYAREHLEGNMTLDTFIIEDYVLINSLRNNTYK